MTSHRILGRQSRARVATAAVLALSFVGCQTANDRLLGVTDPDIINPTDIVNADGAVALAGGAINTFRSATGGGESAWLFGGLLADEWSTSSTFIENDETDQRRIREFNGTVTGLLRTLYRTRTRANEAIASLNQYSPASRALIAEMYFARGFAEMQLASDFCNGIPISNIYTVEPKFETPKTTREVFGYAAASLDTALTYANGTDAQSVLINRAVRVARGRVHLALGQFTEANAVVAAVPTSFVYQHTFSLITSTNTLWGQGLSTRRYSVGDSVEGNSRNIRVTNAIPFASTRDPRLPVTIPTTGSINGQDGQTYARTTTIWGQLTAVDVASGLDARLIQAEAALKTGNVAEWLNIHNALRAAPPKLGDVQPTVMTPLTDPGNEAARVNLHFREKAFWTFSRGQRLGDMRRLITQYGRTEATVFPQGTHYKGGTYGTDVNLPIVTDERNNPEFKGCTDRVP